MKYKDARFWNNLEKVKYDGVGRYNIPELKPVQYDGLQDIKWIGFNYASSCRNRVGKGVHFYLDDYQFERIWYDISRYSSLLSTYDVTLTPDWSMYRDWPLAVNIWNHYRNNYFGAYMQELGVVVIPSVNWAGEDTFDWCFDGVPIKSCVAVTSIGTQMNNESRFGFIYGYDAMIERLQPSTILFWGIVPSECRGNIIKMNEFHSRFSKISDVDGGVIEQ